MNRGFFEATRWILRTGAPLHDLPLAFGAWSSISVDSAVGPWRVGGKLYVER